MCISHQRRASLKERKSQDTVIEQSFTLIEQSILIVYFYHLYFIVIFAINGIIIIGELSEILEENF